TLDPPNSSQLTPLIYAILYDNFSFAELLLSNSASPNIQTFQGITPLSLVQSEKTQKILLKFGTINPMAPEKKEKDKSENKEDIAKTPSRLSAELHTPIVATPSLELDLQRRCKALFYAQKLSESVSAQDTQDIQDAIYL